MEYISVRELTNYLKKKIDSDYFLNKVMLKGEISNFTNHSRGHFYFTLKDASSQISVIMFQSYAQHVNFNPKAGDTVLVSGSVTIYEAAGRYQIVVNKMEEFGKGDIFLQFEKLKLKLSKLGLFDQSNKKPIKKYPKNIGVITSPTGAAIRDIYDTINRRYPLATIHLYPTLVQGESAKFDIVKSIEKANILNECDCLIVGRGGGSIEDLWAFNEEIVALAIHNSKIPIISAVGHETDFTIADFVADLRAATPTAAAELAVPDKLNILKEINNYQNRLYTYFQNKIAYQRNRLQNVNGSYVFANSIRMFESKELKLDSLINKLEKNNPTSKIKFLTEKLNNTVNRLNSSLSQNLNLHSKKIYELRAKIDLKNPKVSLDNYQNKLKFLTSNLNNYCQNNLKFKQSNFVYLLNKLELVNPLAIMKKGYSLTKQNSLLIKSVEEVAINQKLIVEMHDGKLICKVESKEIK